MMNMVVHINSTHTHTRLGTYTSYMFMVYTHLHQSAHVHGEPGLASAVQYDGVDVGPDM